MSRYLNHRSRGDCRQAQRRVDYLGELLPYAIPTPLWSSLTPRCTRPHPAHDPGARSSPGWTRLPPEPDRKRQRTNPSSDAANGRREPCQLAPRAVPGVGRTRADASQAQVLGAPSNEMAAVTRHHGAVSVERIGHRHPGGSDPGPRVHVADDLATGQRAFHEDRSVVFPKFFRFIRPAGDEGPEIQARRHHVLVQIEGRETVRRVPAVAPSLREARVEWIGPGRLGDTPPGVIVGDSLDDQVRRQLCARSKSNMSRHADSSRFVSPWPSRSSRETPSSFGIGRRTTAGIRSRLR